MPESPRWLISRDEDDKAQSVLRDLHRTPDDESNSAALEEYEHIRRQLNAEKSVDTGLIAVLKKPTYRKRFLMGLFVQCLAQSTGVLVINNFSVLLYNALGLYGSLPLMLYAIYASWAAFLNWAGAMFVDRFGRIRMLVIGIVSPLKLHTSTAQIMLTAIQTGCAFMVACETAMVAVYGGTNNRVGNGFGVFFLFCFVTFYGSCVDAISYVYCSELFPTALRAQGIGFSVVGLFAMTLSK